MAEFNHDEEQERHYHPENFERSSDEPMEHCVEAMLCQNCGLEPDAPDDEVADKGCSCKCHIANL